MQRLVPQSVLLIFYLLLFSVSFTSAQGGADFYYDQGVQAYNHGRFAEAYRNFRLYEPIARPPKEFYVYFAMSALRSGHDDALQILRRGLKRFPGDPDLTLVAVQLLAEQKHFAQAMQLLQKARRRILPQEYRSLMGKLAFNRGVQLYQKGKKKESLAYFRQAVDLVKDDARFVRNLAVVLWETGSKKQAVQLLEQKIRLFPDDDQMNALLLTFYQKMGAAAKLQQRLESNARRTGRLDDYLILARFYLLSGNEAKANSLFKMLQKRFPQNKKVYLTWIDYYRKVFRYDKVEAILNEMHSRFSGDTLVCRLRAENFEAMDSLHQAADLWRECLQKYPHKAEWHFKLLQDLRKTDSVQYRIHLKEAERLLTDNQSRLRIALAYMGIKEFRQAMPILQQLVRFDSADGVSATYLGLCYRETGDDSLAAYWFRKAIANGNALPQAYFGLAHLAYEAGHKKQSDDYFTMGLERLLDRLRKAQKLTIAAVNREGASSSSGRSKRLFRTYEDDEQLLKRELRWYQNSHSAHEAVAFLEELLQRFPKNAFLRIMLAELYLDKKEYERANRLLNDVLFMKPTNERALRLKIKIAMLQGNALQAFRNYLNLLYHAPERFTAGDYRTLMETARKCGQMHNLAQQLLLLHEQRRGDSLLKQFTVEALHYAGDHAKARAVAAESSQKKSLGRQDFVPVLKSQ